MTHKLTSTLFALVTATAAYADDGYGTAAEAEAMLQRAVIAMEADPAAALATFTAGEDGFRDRVSDVSRVVICKRELRKNGKCVNGTICKSFQSWPSLLAWNF